MNNLEQILDLLKLIGFRELSDFNKNHMFFEYKRSDFTHVVAITSYIQIVYKEINIDSGETNSQINIKNVDIEDEFKAIKGILELLFEKELLLARKIRKRNKIVKGLLNG
jgi:hypothetical protein